MVIGGKSAPSGTDVGTTEMFTPVGVGEGEGEGEGSAGEGEGEGSAISCAIVTHPSLGALGSIVDMAAGGSAVFYVDANGLEADNFNGTGFDAPANIVPDNTIVDLTSSNGVITASSPSTGLIYAIDPVARTVLESFNVKTGVNPAIAPQSAIAVPPSSFAARDYVVLDVNTHNITQLNNGDGILQVGTQTRFTSVQGDGDKLWFAGIGTSGIALVQNLGTQGYDFYALPLPAASGTTFGEGAGQDTTPWITVGSDQNVYVSVQNSTGSPAAAFVDIQQLSATASTSLGNAVLPANESVIASALAGSFLVIGSIHTAGPAIGTSAVNVFDVANPSLPLALPGEASASLGETFARAYALDATHVVFFDGTLVDVSACLPP
jgi:hypothetical protein